MVLQTYFVLGVLLFRYRTSSMPVSWWRLSPHLGFASWRCLNYFAVSRQLWHFFKGTLYRVHLGCASFRAQVAYGSLCGGNPEALLFRFLSKVLSCRGQGCLLPLFHVCTVVGGGGDARRFVLCESIFSKYDIGSDRQEAQLILFY